ncbi:MAG TPA: hypothetical protein VH325_06960 [Bryobacteraceae bacterium]|nr:hypothetical protein [Bryobacteraceae bacterium]
MLTISSAASEHLSALMDHWRWLDYWTENDPVYRMSAALPREDAKRLAGQHMPPSFYHEGRPFRALLFWDKRPGITLDVGYCSAEFATCEFYSVGFQVYRWQMPPNMSEVKAFEKFALANFAQHFPVTDQYDYQEVSVTLPRLGLPDAIRQRRSRPASEINKLVPLIACPSQYATTLEVPYYNPTDPCVFIHRTCVSADGATSQSLWYPNLSEGEWFVGLNTGTDGPVSRVQYYRHRIENALMRTITIPATTQKK